MNLEMDLD